MSRDRAETIALAVGLAVILCLCVAAALAGLLVFPLVFGMRAF